MNSFKEKLLRLKNELKISTDKEVAAVLGMKPTAFAERKKTNSFPDKQVFDLAREHPDLDIDYILLGHRRETYEAIEREMLKDMPKADEVRFNPNKEMGNLMPAENLLLQYFRSADKESKETILNVAKMAAMFKSMQIGSNSHTTKMHIDNVEQQNNIEHLEGGIHFKKGK